MSTFLVAALAALAGAAFCFAGYRLFLVLLPIWGFFAGFWLGGWAVHQLLGSGFLATVSGLVAGLVLGIGLATFSYFFFTAGVAWVAGGFAAALTSGVLVAVGVGPSWASFLIVLGAGILVAVLTPLWKLQKLLVIVVTALAGADLLVVAALLLLGRVSVLELQAGGSLVRPVVQGAPLWWVVGLGLAVAGMLAQVRLNRQYSYLPEPVFGRWR